MPIGGSDPGPRFRENELADLCADDELDRQSRGSLATENSDEEPLEGCAADHVEAMLRKCLLPDERDDGGDGDDDDDELSSDSDWGQGELLGDAPGGEAEPVKDASPESDIEEIEEEAALRLHIMSLNRGLREFDAWASACLETAQMRVAAVTTTTRPAADAPADRSATSAAASGGGRSSSSHGEGTKAIAARCAAALSDVRALHADLRVLAVNNQALVCASTQQLLRLSHAQAETALRHHQQTRRRHKQLRIVRKETARLCRELETREADSPPPPLLSPPSQSSQQPSQKPPEPLAAPLVELRGGTAPAALLAHVMGVQATASAASSTDRPEGADAPSSRPRTPLDGRLVDAPPARPATAKGGGGGVAALAAGDASGPAVPKEMLSLMARACDRASRPGSRAAEPPPQRPSSSREPRSRRLGGQISPFAPPPVPRRGLGASPGTGAIDPAARAVLKQPAVQAALAEALWQALAEQQLAELKASGTIDLPQSP